MAAVTEDITIKKEFNHPVFEIVNFTTATQSGDHYDCIKIATIEGAIASQSTKDSEDIQLSYSTLPNGRQRVTFAQKSASAVKGWLIIVGRK